MNNSQWSQLLAIIRLEIWKTFFSRRGLWIYLFALAPVLLFTANSIYAPREQARLARIAGSHPVAITNLVAITTGMTNSVVLEMLGEPYQQRNWRHPIEGGRVNERGFYSYTDGKSDFTFHFNNGRVRWIERSDPQTLPLNLLVFATIFRFYFLRLAVFFGCVAIFTNLVRGEMLDKSLHFYLLTPVRREICWRENISPGCSPRWSSLRPAPRCNGWPCSGNSVTVTWPHILPDRRRRISCLIWA